jgi:hypothetical protein
MPNLLDINAQSQSLDQPSLRSFEILKSLAANYCTRHLIRDAEDYFPAAFIRQGDSILHQGPEVEIRLGLLELQRFIFLRVQPFLEFLDRNGHVGSRVENPPERNSHAYNSGKYSTRFANSSISPA